MIIFTFILAYISYAFVCGLFLSIRYIMTEKRIVYWNEFLYLLLISPFGYGNWLYERENRSEKKMVFSKKWFVWKKMIPINIGFLFLSLLLLIWTALESSIPTEADIISKGFSYIIMFIGAIIIMMLLYLIFISFPKYMVKSIEKKQNTTPQIAPKKEVSKIIDGRTEKVVKPSNKNGIDLLTRIIIQIFGSLIIGFIFAYSVYEEPRHDPGNFMGPLGILIITGIVFLVGFVLSFVIIWLIFLLLKRNN